MSQSWESVNITPQTEGILKGPARRKVDRWEALGRRRGKSVLERREWRFPTPCFPGAVPSSQGRGGQHVGDPWVLVSLPFMPLMSPPQTKPWAPILLEGPLCSLPSPATYGPPKQQDLGFPGGSVVKNLPVNTGDTGSIPGSRRSPAEGNGNLLPYSCLENSTDRGVRWATVHRVSKSQTWLSD